MITSEQVHNWYLEADSKWRGDNVWQGLQIIAKYINPMEHKMLEGATHDEIYGPSVSDLIEKGMTELDFKALFALNWHYDSEQDGLNCFV